LISQKEDADVPAAAMELNQATIQGRLPDAGEDAAHQLGRLHRVT
jgi:hypothetical protein